MLANEKLGTVREDYIVVLGEAFFGKGKGGDDEDGTVAEAEEEYGAEPSGEVVEGAVKGETEVVEVADDGE